MTEAPGGKVMPVSLMLLFPLVSKFVAPVVDSAVQVTEVNAGLAPPRSNVSVTVTLGATVVVLLFLAVIV